MGKVDRLKKKRALDNIPDHKNFLLYRWKVLGTNTEEVTKYRRYVEELEIYEKIRWPEDHYKRWERFAEQCKRYEAGEKVMEKYEYDATKMLVRLGARPMYWMGLITDIMKLGGSLDKAKYIKGMTVDIPEDMMHWFEPIPTK